MRRVALLVGDVPAGRPPGTAHAATMPCTSVDPPIIGLSPLTVQVTVTGAAAGDEYQLYLTRAGCPSLTGGFGENASVPAGDSTFESRGVLQEPPPYHGETLQVPGPHTICGYLGHLELFAGGRIFEDGDRLRERGRDGTRGRAHARAGLAVIQRAEPAAQGQGERLDRGAGPRRPVSRPRSCVVPSDAPSAVCQAAAVHRGSRGSRIAVGSSGGRSRRRSTASSVRVGTASAAIWRSTPGTGNLSRAPFPRRDEDGGVPAAHALDAVDARAVIPSRSPS